MAQPRSPYFEWQDWLLDSRRRILEYRAVGSGKLIFSRIYVQGLSSDSSIWTINIWWARYHEISWPISLDIFISWSNMPTSDSNSFLLSNYMLLLTHRLLSCGNIRHKSFNLGSVYFRNSPVLDYVAFQPLAVTHENIIQHSVFSPAEVYQTR